MKIKLAAFRNITSGNISVFEFNAEAYDFVRLSEFGEVELPERDPQEVAAATIAIKARKVAELSKQIADLDGVSP
jgi:hypothetical protein